MLLKSTYEERIFHTLMQRDQGFRILIGSKRSQLGRPPAEDEDPDAEDPDASELEGFSEASEFGMLTQEELDAVMLDLRPTPLLVNFDRRAGPADPERSSGSRR